MKATSTVAAWNKAKSFLKSDPKEGRLQFSENVILGASGSL